MLCGPKSTTTWGAAAASAVRSSWGSSLGRESISAGTTPGTGPCGTHRSSVTAGPTKATRSGQPTGGSGYG